MAETKTIKIDVDTKGAVKSVDNFTESTKQASDQMKSAGSNISDVSGNLSKLNPAFGGAINGAKGLLTSFKALVMNPIGAVIVAVAAALTGLVKAFTSTKAGGEQLEQFMAGLGAVMDIIRDRILAAGSAIKKFFTGDFKGALNEAKKAVSGFGAEVSKEFKAAGDATKQLQKADDEMRKLGVSRAKLNRDLAKTKEIITDENASLEEKRKALELVRNAEQKQTDAELKNAERKLKAIKAKNALSDTSKEDLQKEADAEAALYALQEQSAQNIRSLNKQEKLLKRQQNAEDKEANAARLAQIEEEKKAKDEAIKKISQAERDYADSLLSDQEREKVAVKRKYEELITEAERFGLDTTKLKEAEAVEKEKIDKKYEDARLKIIADANKKANDLRIQAENEYLAQIEALDEANYQAGLTEQQREVQAVSDKYFALEEAAKNNAAELAIIEEAKARELGVINDKYRKSEEDKEKQIRDGKVKLAMDALSLVSNLTELFGKRSEKQAKIAFNIDKAAKIASSTIATIEGTIEAWKTAQKSPITALNPAYPAIQASLTAAFGAAGIAKIAAARFGGGGGSSSVTPSTGGGVGGGVMSPSFNVVGNSGMNQLAQIQQQPIQAYVVSGEVTSAQALDRNRIKNATL
jgi:hypothetical protein